MRDITKVIKEMTNYYSGDIKRINHFMKVYSIAKTIGELENIDEETQYILEIAAATHDIGIKLAEEKYNSSAGNYQEKEGPKIAKELLEKLGINSQVIERVCYLIGHHHSYSNIEGKDYEILIESDFLVNIYEDNIDEKAIQSIKEKYFNTNSGKELLKDFYLINNDIKEEVLEEAVVEPMKMAINIYKDEKFDISKAIFYHIYPLGFCGAPKINDKIQGVKSTLKRIQDWIPHLVSLNVNALYLGPIFESTEHGYDTDDYYVIDRRLGTNEDFKYLVQCLHENGIKVVLDGVFNHVGRNFWAFRDVITNKQNSKYCGWFNNLNFNSHSPMGDPFNYDAWEGHYNLVKLNLKNPEVVSHLLGAVGMWMDDFKIDGLRLDAADCVDIDFFYALNQFSKAKREDFWLMGEIIHGDYTRWAKPGCLDSVTNYECYKGIYSSHNDKNYFEIAHSLNRLFGSGGLYKDLTLYSFADNHDVNRVASTLKDKRNLLNEYTMVYTIPGVPSVYYGSEWGIEGTKANGSDENLRPELNLSDVVFNDLSEHICKLGGIRSQLKSLRKGNYEQVLVRNEQFIFKRTFEDETTYILLNLADNDFDVTFDVNGQSEMKDYLTGKKVVVNNNKVSCTIPNHGAMIFS